VRALRRILEEADDASLVLLDEVGGDTDPAEGAALAAAVLAALTARGALTLATTHLGALKELASHTPGVVNGSLQFDAATLAPTFRFEKGVPGRSYGLAIARRLGLDPGVLADAEARVPETERRLDTLLAAAEERSRALAAERAALEERRRETEALAARLAAEAREQERREAELARREKTAERRAREQARSYLLEARERVEEALGRARAASSEEEAREARRLVEEGIRRETAALADTEEPAAAPAGPGERDAIRVGTRVRLASGGAGEVAEIREDGRLVVVAGAVRLVVDPKNVVAVEGRDGGVAGGAARRAERRPAAPAARAAADAPAEVDLRGLSGDEAEAATLAAVDAAVLAERPFLRIIHGMGTGVVRERVHRVVRGDRRVARFGFAPPNQGGTGVTIVEFSA